MESPPTSAERAPGDPAGRTIAQVRFRAIRVMRVVSVAVAAPNIAIQAWQVSQAGPSPMAVALTGLTVVLAIAPWLVTERHLAIGAAAFALLVAVAGTWSMIVIGLTPGVSVGLAVVPVLLSVFYGTRAGVLGWVGLALVLAGRTAWIASGRVPVPPFPGAIPFPPMMFVRYALGLLAYAGVLLALVSAVIRGLEDAMADVTRSLQRERSERLARIGSERELSRALQMESIGRLARGVVHDTRNALVALAAGLEELREKPGAPPDPDVVADMERALRAARETMGQLGVLGRAPGPDATRPPALALAAAVEEFARGFRRLLPESLEVIVEADPGPSAHVDGALLEQALLNLCLNARDAMPGGGHVTLRVLAGERSGALRAFVEVCDDGPGMPDEVRARLFEPGFTTKGEGIGSGLGLSMVQRFARNVGGDVEVESAPGAGTCIRLVLPRAQAAVAPG